MAQQSARRGRENHWFPQCFEHALGEMDQARELPYRPAAQHRIRGRTDGSIRLRTTTIPKFLLPRRGASTDGMRSAARASTLARGIASAMRLPIIGDRPHPGGRSPSFVFYRPESLLQRSRAVKWSHCIELLLTERRE